MKALSTIQFVLMTLLLAGRSAHAQLGEPPVAEPPPQIFLDPIQVVLKPAAQGNPLGAIVVYDVVEATSSAPWDSTAATEYTAPIQLTASRKIRAQSYIEELGVRIYSQRGEYVYTRNHAPTVTITSPVSGAVLRRNGSYSIVANPVDSDPGDPVTVRFQYRSGNSSAWNNIGTSNAAPYSVTWEPEVSATHWLRAIVTDSRSATANSAEVQVIVTQPNQPPTGVAVTAPAAGSIFPNGTDITITASARDQDTLDAGILRVEFYHDDSLISSDATSPYTATWRGTTGAHLLRVRAYDNNQPPAMTASDTVRITVLPPNARPTVTTPTSDAPPSAGWVALAATNIYANAADAEGGLTGVAFYQNGSLLGRDLTPPYSWPVTGMGAGAHSFTARSFDNSGDSSNLSAALTLTVAANQAPVARAGNDTAVTQPVDTVVLNGSASSDPEGTSLIYLWSAPANSGVTFSNANVARPTVRLPNTARFTLTLQVTDRNNPPLSATDQVVVTLQSRPALTSKLIDTATVGIAYTYTITGSGFPAPRFTAANLPAGIALQSNGITLSGTPTGNGGQFTINLAAINDAGTDSRNLALAIRKAPAFTTNLQTGLTVQERTRVTLSVTATGYPAPTYQWQKVPTTGNPANVGTNSPTLVLDTVSLSAAGNYRVLVINSAGTATSQTCRLDVAPMIRFTTQPLPATVVAGRSATFRVRATGAPTLLYQWFRGSVSMGAPAAADSNFVLAAAKTTDAGLYRVRITNPWNDSTKAIWSDTARLTVNLPKLDVPKSNPPVPHFYGDQGESLVITLATDTPSTEIRYTTNGTDPTAATGTIYNPASKPTFSQTTVNLRAKAFRSGYQESDMFYGTYTYVPPKTTAKPTAWPLASLLPSNQTWLCTLKTTTDPATIRFTTNGTNPKTSAFQTYEGPFPLTKSQTTIIAYAIGPSGHTDSDTLMRTFIIETPKPKAPAPVANPKGGTFSGQDTISLSALVDSAVIWFTLDGSSPENSPTRQQFVKSAPIVIRERTVLKAQVTAPNQQPSDILTETYVPVPGPITALPAMVDGNYVFDGSVRVTLSVPQGAPIYYTLNDSLPLDPDNRPVPEAFLYTSAGIQLQNSCTITAVALADGSAASAVFRFLYTKLGGTLLTPLVTTSNGANAFKDTLRIRLTSTKGATIRYTRDGSLPNTASAVYTEPFTIDTSETLQAIASHPQYQDSRILFASFTLVADTPRATPRGATYFSPQRVTLAATSKRTPIRYTTDGSIPGPDNGFVYHPGEVIPVTGFTDLKAVALLEGVPGPLMAESYRVIQAIDTVLLPGDICFLEGGYSISNPVESPAAVRMIQGASDDLDLRGFEQVQSRITLSAVAAAGPARAFPSLVLARPPGETRGLYKVDGAGQVNFISAAERIVIIDPGTYFMGVDVMRPAITYRGELVDAAGATAVRFRIEDNVQNLLLSTRRSDDPALNLNYELVASGYEPEFTLRPKAGILKPLLIQLSVTDFTNVSFLPADGRTHLPLSQALTDFDGAGSWRIGFNAKKPHDLVGIPLNLEPPLTLANLPDSRSGKVEGFVYVEATNSFRRMSQGEALVPGQAYWLAARAQLKGFHLASARLKGTGSEKFSVNLKRGWNQVSNPSLDTLYWPVNKGLGSFYNESQVKRLWEYTPNSPDAREFHESIRLEPWKGYYVYNFAGDTAVQLSNRPPVVPIGFAQAKAGADPYETDLVMAYGDAPPVQLAASPASRDAATWEDERLLPAIGSRHAFQALRDGVQLSCDWVRFGQDEVLGWKVLPRSREGETELPPLRILRQALPEGYEAWAVSGKRGMKFLLGEGREIPVSGLPDDTLRVVAGPAAKLAGMDLLQGLSQDVSALDLRVRQGSGGPEFLLDLPGRSRIRATLWSLRGASLGELGRELSAGHYRFRFAEDFRRHVAKPGSGVHLLRVEIAAPGAKPAYITRKVVFKD